MRPFAEDPSGLTVVTPCAIMHACYWHVIVRLYGWKGDRGSMVENGVLLTRVEELQKELEEKRQYIATLERANKELEQRVESASETAEAAPITELEETLKRLVARVAAILQAEKCVFLLLDKERGELVATKPAFGLTDEEVKGSGYPGSIRRGIPRRPACHIARCDRRRADFEGECCAPECSKWRVRTSDLREAGRGEQSDREHYHRCAARFQ